MIDRRGVTLSLLGGVAHEAAVCRGATSGRVLAMLRTPRRPLAGPPRPMLCENPESSKTRRMIFLWPIVTALENPHDANRDLT
jgi:hypothetical protein